MRSTKFVVVKMRELLKTAVFAVLGVVILVGLITFFLRMGGEESTALYQDGTYEALLQAGSVESVVCLSVENGKISDFALKEPSETLTVMYPMVETAVEEVKQELKGKENVEGVKETMDTYSKQTVWEAVEDCLTQAEKR